MNTQLLTQVNEKLNRIYLSLHSTRFIPGGFHYLQNSNPGEHTENGDTTGFKFSQHAFHFGREGSELWAKFKVTVPVSCKDISNLGSTARLITCFQAPTEVYVDQKLVLKEKTWVDFKNPEVVLCEKIEAEQTYDIAIKISVKDSVFSDLVFWCELVIDSVDDIQYDIQSFISELSFIENFESARNALPCVLENLFEKCDMVLSEKLDIPSFYKEIKSARAALECVREEAKSKTVHLIGHAHLDMNWFWEMDETADLIKRDFTSMCNVMDENPEFKFSQSQCAVYDIAQKQHQKLFERVSEKIKSGQWDVTAAAWVEGDLDMSSGESLCRHILYSKKYLDKQFGVDPKIMWCPDTFGHTSNLPQILRDGGIEHYYGMRVGIEHGDNPSDNYYYGTQVSDEPFFIWRGADGSEVYTYNAAYNFDMYMSGIVNNSQLLDKLKLNNSMFVYGTGDHGGGPTKRDVKRAKQAMSYPTTPNIVFSRTDEFFDSVRKEDLSNVPVFEGERNLFMEGCYTSHADIKKCMRDSENALYTTEFLASRAAMLGYKYPYEKLTECWKTTLFNQFHDIYCGCAFAPTYAYAREQFACVMKTLEQIKADAAAFLSKHMENKKLGTPVFVCNPLFTKRDDTVLLNLSEYGLNSEERFKVLDSDGTELLSQQKDGILTVRANLKPCEIKFIYCVKDDENKDDFAPIMLADNIYTVETDCFYAKIKADSGEIITLFDKLSKYFVCREQKPSWRAKRGRLNQLVYYTEQPRTYSAWEIDESLTEKPLINGAKSEIIKDGLLQKIIRFTHTIDASVLTQDIIFTQGSPVIKFKTSADWKETGNEKKGTPSLRVRFTPAVAADKGLYEIPFGTINRPNNDDVVPALMFSAVSDGLHGCALLNNCKYGHKIAGNCMELFLIRSSWEPDLYAAVGQHEFTYAFYSYDGDSEESSVFSHARQLNIPAFVSPAASAGTGNENIASLPFIEITSDSGENIAVSSIKSAEEKNGYILRFFETFGKKCGVTITLPKNISCAAYSNILEGDKGNLNIHNNKINISVEPYRFFSIFLSEGDI